MTPKVDMSDYTKNKMEEQKKQETEKQEPEIQCVADDCEDNSFVKQDRHGNEHKKKSKNNIGNH